MQIIEEKYNFKNALSVRKKTDYIVLHHAATKTAGDRQYSSLALKAGMGIKLWLFYVAFYQI